MNSTAPAGIFGANNWPAAFSPARYFSVFVETLEAFDYTSLKFALAREATTNPNVNAFRVDVWSNGALLVPNGVALRELSGVSEDVLSHPSVQAALTERLSAHARSATGSASRVVAAMVLETPLSFDLGEVTDKGSVNQRAVLRERADLVAALWAGDARVIAADWKGSR